MYKCYLCDYKGDMKIKSNVNGRDIVECPECKLQFMHPQTSDEELNNIYSSTNYPTCSFDTGDDNLITNMKRKTFKNILKKILPYCDNGNLLDIGCSSGLLLEEAKSIGFNVYGLEISQYASSIAKKRIGNDRIHNGTLETSQFDKNFFDIITMIDVIEHFRDPISTLLDVKKIINNLYGGEYILITTPNTDSLTNKLMGKRWAHYNSEHLYYFNLESIKKLCQKIGFELVFHSDLIKTIRLDYMYFQMKEHNQGIIFDIIKIIKNIPLINNIDFPISSGDFIVILKKIS